MPHPRRQDHTFDGLQVGYTTKELAIRRLVGERRAPSRLSAWYQSNNSRWAASKATRRPQIRSDRLPWARYFERWGCVICETKDAVHEGGGLCHSCHVRTYKSESGRCGLRSGRAPRPTARRDAIH